MTDDYKPLIIGGDYSRLLQCIDDLRALILPVVEAHEARQAENPPVMVPQDAEQGETLPVGEPQEVRPAKRTRTGLSVAEREAKKALKLFKEKKRMEIHEFRMNYQGPPYHPVERFLWGTLCRDYNCPMGYEAFSHEVGEDCNLDPMEVWKLPPIDIVLKPDAARAYREAEAALAEAKEKNPNWSMNKDWICDNQSCPNLYRHARGEACKLKMEDMLPLTTMPKDPDCAKTIKGALELGWKYSGMKPFCGMYCVNNLTEEKCNN
jgi:hypothetical protein